MPETTYENAEILSAREKRRAELAGLLDAVLAEVSALPDGKRLSWYQKNRGEFFFKSREIAARIKRLNQAMPGRREEIVDAAERLLRHEFDILGSGPKSLGAPIPWQLDFKSNISWRNDVIYPSWNWRKVDRGPGEEIYQGHYYSVDDPSDLKVPWDLSSFFHLPALGEAFQQTGDARYAQEILTELDDWHTRNPFPRGVNWTCAMVLGIRLANFGFGLRLIESHPDYAGYMDRVGVKSILTHLRSILENFEVDQDGRRNNHYLNNLVGLAFGGIELARHPAGTALLDFVHQEIGIELLTQFSRDGTNFEGTIPYHRFATESTLLVILLLDRNGRQLTPEGREQLRRMMRFIDSYTKANGLAPQIGDNDNGRILVLHQYIGQEYRDHRHILAVGARYLDDPPLSTDVSDQSADVIWLLGKPAPKRTARRAPFLAAHHGDNGFLVAKTADSNLIIRCGRLNPMSGGGHNHCDQLSFDLHDRGQDLIIDPGAMVYSADSALRNAYRSTAAHNLVQLDALEQQAFTPRDLFAMQDRCQATTDCWAVKGSDVTFRGHHLGYSESGWRVEREMVWAAREGRLQLVDSVHPVTSATQGSTFCGRLHLAAGVEVQEQGPRDLVLRADGKAWRLCFEEGVEIKQSSGHVSPSYGIQWPAVVIEYRFPAQPGSKARLTLERADS